jgi:hypothetical protein
VGGSWREREGAGGSEREREGAGGSGREREGGSGRDHTRKVKRVDILEVQFDGLLSSSPTKESIQVHRLRGRVIVIRLCRAGGEQI